jgi:hypothetical protein
MMCKGCGCTREDSVAAQSAFTAHCIFLRAIEELQSSED